MVSLAEGNEPFIYVGDMRLSETSQQILEKTTRESKPRSKCVWVQKAKRNESFICVGAVWLSETNALCSWVHEAKERRYILFWVFTHQYIYFRQKMDVFALGIKQQIMNCPTHFIVLFSNLDKSRYCFEYKHTCVKEKLVHSKILIQPRIFF